MSASRKRPTGPPPSAGVLARYAQAYARELGVAKGRVRAWVADLIMAGVLDGPRHADLPLFIVQGDVALELRCATAHAPQRTSTSSSETRLLAPADSHEQALTGELYQGLWLRRRGPHSCGTTAW